MHLYKGLLELNSFSQAPRGCLRMLSLQVRTVYMGPGEVLLAQNDVINAIYYIANGSMEVLQGESVAAILGKSIVIVLQFSVCFSCSKSEKVQQLWGTEVSCWMFTIINQDWAKWCKKKCFFTEPLRLWNELPKEIACSNSIKMFMGCLVLIILSCRGGLSFKPGGFLRSSRPTTCMYSVKFIYNIKDNKWWWWWNWGLVYLNLLL